MIGESHAVRVRSKQNRYGILSARRRGRDGRRRGLEVPRAGLVEGAWLQGRCRGRARRVLHSAAAVSGYGFIAA